MQTNSHLWLILCLVFMFTFTACERAEEDILHLMPDNTQLLFENNYVRVLHVTLEPGEGQPLHTCNNRFIYALTGYTINYYQPNDTTQISWNEGGIHWHEKGVHAVENAGETLVDYLAIERKDARLPAATVEDPPPATLETGYWMEIFENDHAHVARISLPPGESIPEHDGYHRLVYSLSNYEIRYASEEKGTVEKSFSSGDFHWHAADMHAVENIGDDVAEYILFGFKH
jgi:beta-alanine degradation protein BauB